MTNKNAELCSNGNEEVDYRAVASFLYVRVRVYRQVHLWCRIIARYLKRAACWKTHTCVRKHIRVIGKHVSAARLRILRRVHIGVRRDIKRGML